MRNVRWVAEVPQSGGASPLPVGDLVLVMVEPDVLTAFSRCDGKKVWEAPVDLVPDTAKAELVRSILRRGLATPVKEQKPVWDEAAKVAGVKIGPGEFGWAIPTPVSDGKTIWATLSTGVVAAFDLAGKRLWRMERTKARNGGASPLIVDGLLLIWGRSGVVALTPETGEERWFATFTKEQQADRFGSPVVWKNAGNTYLIGSNRIAVRVSDGKIVQTNAELRSNEASPMVIGNRIIFTQGNDHGGGEQTLEGCDLAISGDRLTLTPVWKRLTGTPPKQTHRDFTRVTPLVVGTVFCTVIENRKNGLLFGDLATGVEVDQKLPVVCAGSVHAWSPSPIQAGDLVILPHRDGKVEILKPGTPWTLTSAFSLDAPMAASPSASGGDLFLLTGKSLYCLGAK
jgi:outer membrane protein assembly factor BamB